MNEIRVNFVGKVRLVILPDSEEIARHPKDGSVKRAYIEFDNLIMSEGSTLRQELAHTADPLKPLRLPVFIGELAAATQEGIE